MSHTDSKDENIGETIPQHYLTLQILLFNLLLSEPQSSIEKKKANNKDYRQSRKFEKPPTKQYKEKNKSTHWQSMPMKTPHQRGERQ